MSGLSAPSHALHSKLPQGAINRTASSLLKVMRHEILPLPEATLFRCITGRRQYKTHALRDLLSEGKVSRLGSGVRGNPYLYLLQSARSVDKSREPQDTHEEVLL